MKRHAHPDYHTVTFSCQCGQSYTTRSTINSAPVKLNTCRNCHPFISDKPLILSKQSPINKFHRRYKNKQ
ncbi:MAG: 50S ribosomal protein L31 [Gammaproteobacteria bacterium]